ncbi:MAG: hypothetical protein ACJ8DZ_08780 [Allosphingosinicella sp.]
MAAAQLNLTRRALLGAACVPALGRHAGLDPASTFSLAALAEGRWTPDQVRGDGCGADQVRNDGVGSGAWELALDGVRAALAAVAEIEAATAGASVEEEAVWLPRHDAACARMEAAVARAIALPAPHLEGFAAELELLFAHGIEPGAVDEAWVSAIRKDALRVLHRR